MKTPEIEFLAPYGHDYADYCNRICDAMQSGTCFEFKHVQHMPHYTDYIKVKLSP
jgi:hypothetical protein